MCLAQGFAIPQSSADNIEEDDDSVFTTQNVGFLILSSTFGIIIGDVLWLEALRLLGAKHVIVIDSLFKICFTNKGITDPLEAITFPYLVTLNPFT